MKHFLFLFFLAFAAHSYAQSWDKATVEKLLSKSWEMEYMVDGTDTMKSPPGFKMIFHSDHTMTSSIDTGTATWAYDEAKKSFTLGYDVFQLSVLTEKKLLLEFEEEGIKRQMCLKAK